MKQEDIDKKISMPDVDKEWARFEREVIGKNTKPNWQRLAAWAGGIGTAAAIALLFVLNMGKEETAEQPLMAQQPQPVHVESTTADTIPVDESQSVKSAYEQPQPKLVAYTEPVARNIARPPIVGSTANNQKALQGRIAGLGGDSLIIHFVSKKDYPLLPYLWERDTVMALVNGKEDQDFLHYLSSTSHVSISNIYDYFFERNQLYLKQFIPSKEEQKTRYDASLFEGRDIRLVVDYLTKPFTSVSQLTPEQIKSRRLAYLQNKYQAGFSKNSAQDYYSPDLYDTPAEERLFGLTAAKCRSYGQQHEYFGPMGSDSHGVYIPLIRDVIMTTQDDAWWENGEVWVLKDDPHFNQIVVDILQTATHTESSVMDGDSIVRQAFIYGGKVTEGQPNDQLSGMQKQLYKKVKGSIFKFKPDEDTLSYWWGEAYYSTTSQRQLWMHLHSVDKLYATDCPELLSNRRHVEGIVTDEKGEPLAAALVSISTHATPWDAVKTDSKGHFDMWIPFHDATIHVNHVGYITKQIQPTDTALVIRMREATKLRKVKVLTKEEMNEFQRLP